MPHAHVQPVRLHAYLLVLGLWLIHLALASPAAAQADSAANFGKVNGPGIVWPTRTFKLSLGYNW